jgi:hypothetical protein
LKYYYKYYYQPNTDYTILQQFLDKLNADVLHERYPIIIYDRIVDPRILLSTLFKYSYMFQKVNAFKDANVPQINNHKFNVIFSPVDNIELNIISPLYKRDIENAQYITIKLKKQQTLILPCHWVYTTQSKHFNIMLDDPFSLVFSLFHTKKFENIQNQKYTNSSNNEKEEQK